MGTRRREAAARPTGSRRRHAAAPWILVGWIALGTPSPLPAVVANDGSPVATRLTSTAGLQPDEVDAYHLQGRFRGFLGTPVDDRHFLTAQHVGISLGDTIAFDDGPNAGSYGIVTWYDDPGSDLRLVEVDGTFAAWAPLNRSGYESGKNVLIFGRGGAPDGQVWLGPELKGWTTAPPDGQIGWGRNAVSSTVSYEIFTRFDINGLPEEAGLSTGDSGGAWFLRDSQGLLRLAGISYAVWGPFQLDAGGVPDGAPFEAPLFDVGGLWLGEPGNEVFVPENPVPVPSVGIATRISDRFDWIDQILELEPVDTDRDGVPNDQDNCPFAPNPTQADSGGLGFSQTPDGIGDACQCGDVTGEGQVNDTDAAFVKREALGLAAPLFLLPKNCDVTGEGICNGSDATAIRQAAAGNVTPLFAQTCANALP